MHIMLRMSNRIIRLWRQAVLAGLSLVANSLVVMAEDCPPATGIEVSVDSALGADTLRLDDGRIVKLAGIAIPPAAQPDSRVFLNRHLQGKRAKLSPLAPLPDRYGRVIARLTFMQGEQTRWIEQDLIKAGLALAALTPGETACFPALLASESQARRDHEGYWGVDGSLRFAASNRDAIEAAVGRFIVIEGKIIRVSVRDYAIFLDFGEDWKRDVTIMLRKAERNRVEAALGPMKDVMGRTVQVRGIIAPGASLRLRLTSPDQFRVIEGPR